MMESRTIALNTVKTEPSSTVKNLHAEIPSFIIRASLVETKIVRDVYNITIL